MYKIAEKKVLNPTVVQLQIEAPLVAKKAQPGQFIILRVDEEGERIPLTVAGTNPEKGTVKIIFQIVGATTKALSLKEEGEYIQDFVGPWAALPRLRVSSAWPWSAVASALPSLIPWPRSSTMWAATWI